MGEIQSTSGVMNSGTGLKHTRVTTPSIGALEYENVTVVFSAYFTSTNYTSSCDIEDDSGYLTKGRMIFSSVQKY